MAKKQFKTESRRILDLMINSIYTHKEIFLRELISNASDAIDKRYFQSLKEGGAGLARQDFPIMLTVDKTTRTLTISDKGIGMTKEELEGNLGTIAKSGTLDFRKENELGQEIDVIGQFGVGFYSAFMVARKIVVESRALGSEESWRWQSEGADGYTIEPCQKEEAGTVITLTIKENQGEEDYDQYLEQHTIVEIVKRYSDYIRYPIMMEVTKSRLKEEAPGEDQDKEPGREEDHIPQYESYNELDTLNSMVPLWRRNKDEVKEEDYENFYMEKFSDYEKPLAFIHTQAEGMISYNAILYFPAHAPYNYYSKEYEKGLQLYSSGVLIMDKCADLLPDCFSFVKGLVDSPDLSLNISREMLQQDRQLKAIAKSLEKKIKSELLKLQKDDREKYEKFFKDFGLQIKFGIYNTFGGDKEKLQDLLMYYSLKEDKLVTLAEYAAAMPADQKEIYYVCAKTADRARKLPQTELALDKGYDVLCMMDDVDEFAVKIMRDYQGKEYKSVSDKEVDLESAEEKEAVKTQSETNKDMLAYVKEALEGKVKDVRLTGRLKSHPVCLTSDGPLSLEMEKVLNSMPADQKVKADRVLEINSNHPVFQTMTRLYAEDKEKVKFYAELLYNQALLIEGMTIEDPVAFSNAICQLM
ncbi:MAG: molecular chaperone HtpG [Peptococcaceae bacterium]|nr:molecular chaperone HtpG [Peptococcaceae bacterium]